MITLCLLAGISRVLCPSSRVKPGWPGTGPHEELYHRQRGPPTTTFLSR